MRTLKALATSAALILAAFTAHILAGGGPLSFYSALSLVGALLLIAFFISDTSDNPVRTVIAIFVAQNLSHFIAGGGSGNDNQMVASHLVSAIASYYLLKYLHRTLPSITDFFARVLMPRVSWPILSISAIYSSPGFSYRSLATPFFSLTQSLRAPPFA